LGAVLRWNRSRTRTGAQIQLQRPVALLLARPDCRSQLSILGQEPVGNTSAAFAIKPICALSVSGYPERGIAQRSAVDYPTPDPGSPWNVRPCVRDVSEARRLKKHGQGDPQVSGGIVKEG
jgi:hypothetical protein